MIGGPEVGNPWENLPNVGGQLEAKLVQEKDKCLGLEPLVLEPVPRDQRDRLVCLVVVERNGFLGRIRSTRFEVIRVHFDPAGREEDLLQPRDEGGTTLGDEAVLQHLEHVNDKVLQTCGQNLPNFRRKSAKLSLAYLSLY